MQTLMQRLHAIWVAGSKTSLIPRENRGAGNIDNVVASR